MLKMQNNSYCKKFSREQGAPVHDILWLGTGATTCIINSRTFRIELSLCLIKNCAILEGFYRMFRKQKGNLPVVVDADRCLNLHIRCVLIGIKADLLSHKSVKACVCLISNDNKSTHFTKSFQTTFKT